jgi:hypothetical protein
MQVIIQHRIRIILGLIAGMLIIAAVILLAYSFESVEPAYLQATLAPTFFVPPQP